jgi:acetyl-CoA carboxylase carboxyltransferase component
MTPPEAPPSWQELSWILGGITTAGTIVAACVGWVWKMVSGQSAKVSSLELQMAQKYVTTEAHLAAERRLIDAIESMRDEFRGLSQRLDRFFDRPEPRR